MELYPILESRDAASANIWYVVTPQGPQVDGGVGTKCCAKGSKVIVCGGANPAGAFGNIYEVCLDRFSLRKLKSTVTPRYEHAMVLHDGRLIVFGGAGLEGNMNDVECVDIVNDVKLPVPSSDTAPCPRTIHNVACNDESLYIWGGGAQGSEPVSCTDTFSLDLVTLKWNKLTTSGTPPSPRHGHVLCCTDEMLYVHGGMAGEEFYNDMYSLDLSSGTWSKIELTSPHPSPRAAHIATLHKGKVYMFGGLSKEGALDDLWVFDCKIREWSEVKVAPPSPHPRLDHCMCVVTVPYCKDNVGILRQDSTPRFYAKIIRRDSTQRLFAGILNKDSSQLLEGWLLNLLYRFIKRIAEKLSQKTKESYIRIMNNIRTRLSFDIMRSVLVAIRGSRGRTNERTDPLSSVSFNLVPEARSYEMP